MVLKSLIKESRFVELATKLTHIDPIVVVGDVGLDKYTCGDVNRISPEAPVPIIEVSHEWMVPGMASNISHNLSALNIPSQLVGVIGDDENGTILTRLLEESGVQNIGLIRTIEKPTSCKVRITTKGQQICRVDYESKKDISIELAEKLISKVEEIHRGRGAVIIEDYGKGTLSKNVLERIIKSYKERGQLVCIDPSRNTPVGYYKGASLLKPNFGESKMIARSFGYQGDSIEEICSVLLDKLSLDMVVVTLGGNGMALASKDNRKVEIIPTVASEVFDVSGAGDTAMGLITAALCAGGSLTEAAWLGNCGSGVVVGKVGTATVTQSELLDFYQRLKKKLN